MARDDHSLRTTAAPSGYELPVKLAVPALFASVFLSRSLLVLVSSCVLAAGWFFVLARARRQALRLPLTVPLLAFFAVIALSIVAAEPYPWQKPLGKLRYVALYFPVAIAFIRLPSLNDGVRRVAAVLAAGLGALGLLEMFHLVKPMEWWMGHALAPVPGSDGKLFHATGLLVHHVPFSFGCMLLFHVLFGAYLADDSPHRRRIWLFAAVLAAAGVLSSFSRGTWLALIGSVVVVGFVLSPRRGLMALLSIAIVVGTLAAASGSFRKRLADIRPSGNSERLALWRISWKMFRDAPVLGKGFHSFATYRDRYRTKDDEAFTHFPTETHSLYFDLLGGTGILGLAAFAWFALAALANYLSVLRLPGLSAVDRGTVLGALGSQVGMLIANVTDTHFYLTNSLAGTIFVLAMGQAVVFRYTRSTVEAK